MSLSEKELIILDGGFFYAGVILENNIVTVTAPILKYMIGWTKERVLRYSQKRGFIVKNDLQKL